MKMSFMNIKNCVVILFVAINVFNQTYAQAPPSSGGGMAASRGEAVQVNNFTGIPSIGIPLFSYSGPNGLNFNAGLNYFAGGIKVNESPSAAGLGWNIEAGGVIARTVRGIPDDIVGNGFLYNAALPTDTRPKTKRIVNRAEDAEMDIFQFNFAGRSGKFYIGKDTQCYMVPLSKMRINFTRKITDTVPLPGDDNSEYFDLYSTIKNFTITTEDGTNYLFDVQESQTTYLPKCDSFGNVQSYKKVSYGTGWYLSRIYNSFSKDSIKIAYINTSNLPGVYTEQSVNITNTGIVTHSDTSTHTSGRILVVINNKVPSEVLFPDNKKLIFYYSAQGQYRYYDYPLLQRVKVIDSVFRYGYMLKWDTTIVEVSLEIF
jgi:hypothetical protein